MANPNLVSGTSIVGKTNLVRLTDTNATQVVSNAASSNKLFLVDSLTIANVDGTNACDVTLQVFAAATNTGTATGLINTVTVPADATLVAVSKDSPLLLTEDMSVYATASAGNDLHVICSYKELS
jgi:hypothetical protein